MPKGGQPSQVTLLLRLLCGGYLIYLAYSLFTEAAGSVVFYIAAAVFALVGAVLIAYTLRGVLRSWSQGTEELEEEAPPLLEDADETDGKE